MSYGRPMSRFAPWADCGLAGPVEERVMTVLGLANFAGAILSFVSGGLTATHKAGLAHGGGTDLAIFAAYMTLMMPLGYKLGRRIFARGTAWLRPDDPGRSDADPADAFAVP